MNKTVAAVATLLTTLVLLMIVGIVYSVRASDRDNQIQPQASVEAPAEVQAIQPVTPVSDGNGASFSQVKMVTPEEIVSAAIDFLGRDDVYSVESATINGQDGYRVIYSSGDAVLLDAEGQVTGIEQAVNQAAVSWDDDDWDDDHDDDDWDDDYDDDDSDHDRRDHDDD